jgi:hypothetical protein
MTEQTSTNRYSTIADFELIANGDSYPLVEIGPDFVVLKVAHEIPPGEVELIIRVDGKVIRRQIFLPNGASATSREVSIRRD